MSKTTSKTAETIEFPTFDASQATDQMRAMAEKGVEQTKEAYAKMKDGAETTQKALEETFEAARTSSTEMSLKSIAAMRAGTDSSLSHMEAMLGVKSIADMFELQTAFMRKQMELSVEHAKELQALSTKSFEEVSKPMRSLAEKSMKELKAA
ncbi:phasin [Chelativorans sp. ZYF759]|uniref:phasin n=1 Tax=Chelativorans sp. ZYF759 TaxID=2692213 RepID=UPI00145D442B|nr:phasin [Chelativorans sp. ZYF759]NMG40783.1 phasin [Chelativorans sp. ZYF759]